LELTELSLFKIPEKLVGEGLNDEDEIEIVFQGGYAHPL
jgi:hypothetical protein